MKTTAFAVALLGFLPAVFAQDSVAPSPTESYGCQPHGDHWHCEGARATTGGADAVSTPAAVTTAHDDHDHDGGAGSLAPSPTESVGCQPHGDHWHCEGPRTTVVAVTTSAADHDHDHEHTDAAGTGSIAPSPTESYGCEPHGDHWHCEGARTSGAPQSVTTPAGTPATTPAKSSSAAASTTPATQVVNGAGLEMVPVAGLFFAAVLAI